MSGISCHRVGFWRGVLLIAGLSLVTLATSIRAQNTNMGADTNDGLTYGSGQSAVPIYGGWSRNADGSAFMYFSYLNRNWSEELEVPVGEANNISAPFGPDAGQSTHFYPRNNRWQFKVRVPADFGTKEVVWTLTTHGQTHRAYGSLKPGYIVDEYSIQHEYGSDSTHGRLYPSLVVDGAKTRTAKVGVPLELVAVAKDENSVRLGGGAAQAAAPGPPAAGGEPAAAAPAGRRGVGPRGALQVGPGPVGGGSIRSSSAGLRFVWFAYRGAKVVFDPPQFKSWEDTRFGSPWAPDWVNPPIPEGNRWVVRATFPAPGTYVVRAQAHNGSLVTNEDIVVNVTP